MDEFHYRIPWRAGSAHPGHHPSRAPGGGYEFHAHAPLHSGADPRHLDIRASLCDPFGEFKVRQFLQTSLIPVVAVADLSASMHVGHKPQLLGRISAAIAYSAYRTGDLFGFIGLSGAGRPAIHHPPRRRRGLALDLLQQLQQVRFEGAGLAAALKPTTYIDSRKALVFLLSDFHFPLKILESLLEHLRPHDVVPVVLWLSQEWTPPVRWGWARLREPESGRRQGRLLHPRSGLRLRQAFAHRRRQLTGVCRRHGRPPFFVEDVFCPRAFSRYFLETCA